MLPTIRTPPTAARIIQRLTLPLRGFQDRRQGTGTPLDFTGFGGVTDRNPLAGGLDGCRRRRGVLGDRLAGGVAVAGCVFIDPNSTGIERQNLEVEEKLNPLGVIVNPNGEQLGLGNS
jgi:hypothetical protein